MATKTINLTGAEVAVTGLDGAHAHIRNDGTEVIYAAKTAGITAGADGVASIPAGQSDTIRGISGAVYLLGTGSVLIQSDDYVASPFKTSAASGGSAVDEVARAAASAHAGNAEIHVTAEEKAAGFMSAADKSKLDSVAEGANKYTHPSYTARTGVPTANQTPAFGGTFQVTQPVSDASGHITAMNSRNVTIPATAASASAAGLVSTGAQTFAGNKTFNGQIIPAGATAYGTPQARKLASGTADVTDTNCPSGAWYGKHD